MSLKKNIIPFLKLYYHINFEIAGNDHMTYLILDFDPEVDKFNKLRVLFAGFTSFDSFVIPKPLYTAPQENKIEFVTGFLDAAGFFNSGGWLPRKGKHGIGRMRAYLQIVRNWDMPVLVCNYLKNVLKLPIHTIDWGHPNIRDSKMEDYYNTNPLSWSREHQVKFFPEYYSFFKLRMEHKQEMFNELISHNVKVGFDNKDDCNPPTPITESSLKAYHPGENDIRIPKQIRKHYDAFWQVCHDIGCMFSHMNISKSKNPKVAYLTGKDQKANVKEIDESFCQTRQLLTSSIMEKYKNIEHEIIMAVTKVLRKNPEQALYGPISKWLQQYLREAYSQEAKVHDTSPFYLDKFIIHNNLLEQFDFCVEYKIKPDIVGFLMRDKGICFVEVKIGELTLKDIGQLLGYCLVGNPVEAMLISPKNPSINLIKILKSNKRILDYGGNRIKIGTWKRNTCEWVEI